MNALPNDVEVSITFLGADEGGRTMSPTRMTSYRPQFHYEGEDWDCAIELPAPITLGKSAKVFVSFQSPEKHHGKLQIGTPFLLREGAKIVAYGAISQIVNLPRSAQRALERQAAKANG